MKKYIVRQIDGIILGESEYLDETIKQLVEFKLREFDRYNVSIEEKIEYDRYPYMHELYKLYANSLSYSEDNFYKVELTYNDPHHIPKEEYIKLEVLQYV
ncbi:hypothetical protein ACT9T1_13470 (plasmid) [Staphylococcus xylosus]|uniref:hypothetical protein n=1 Tax=Staphylococcus xylosus TaxID=1288 RepID=UPI00403E6C23